MKRFKCLLLLLCAVILLECVPGKSLAYERKGHDALMLKILFKNFKVVENDSSIQDEIKALECASYLAIDQFNGNGQKDLDFLLNYGVKGIPEDVSSISYKGGGDHRSHTHRGWDFSLYTLTKDLWPTRKQILLNTADKVFDFQGEEAKKNSFCALLYYIHILGDHMADKNHKVKNGLKMDVGGKNKDKEDIIHELLKHIRILFADQKHTHKYRGLTTALGIYNSRLAELVQSEGGINTDEKFQQKQKYVKTLVEDVLPNYLPEMLKNEQFFYKTFYG